MKRKGYVTIRHVAEAANISVSTVSRVLNNMDGVAPATYEKVQEVIKELGYASNLAARSMRSQRNNVIGLVMPDVSQPFPIEVMKGVNEAIRQNDYELLIYTGGDIQKKNTAIQEQYYVSLLNNGVTDGIVLVAPVATSFNTSSPIVSIDPNRETPNIPSITATNRDGALEVMRYLIELGHQRIGFIGGRIELESANRRFTGYKDGMSAAGLDFEKALVEFGDFSVATGRTLAQKLLNLPDPPTAIFAANDQSAMGVMQTAKEMGLSIPDDLSVVGFDNILEAQICNPPLTTVDQSISEMGRLATEMLIQLINGQGLEDPLQKVATRLIIRQSCGKPKR